MNNMTYPELSDVGHKAFDMLDTCTALKDHRVVAIPNGQMSEYGISDV